MASSSSIVGLAQSAAKSITDAARTAMINLSESSTMDGFYDELRALEGLKGQDRETGMDLKNAGSASLMKQYTNRLMGAPYQLLDTVDERFPSINSRVGSEYLRNFIFNSPILYVKPGMPKYTGHLSETGVGATIKNLYSDTTLGGMSTLESLIASIGSAVFASGKNLQRRMFGFKETYLTYMQHVNYMLHNIANLMGLMEGKRYPNIVFTSAGANKLNEIKWENYRMMSNRTVMNQTEYLGAMLSAAIDGPLAGVNAAGTTLSAGFKSALTTLKAGIKGKVTGGVDSDEKGSLKYTGNLIDDVLKVYMNPSTIDELSAANREIYSDALSEIQADFADNKTISDVIGSKITSVQFMVEPVSFEETLTNEIGPSMISSAVDGLNTIGQELQWMTNSEVDAGVLGAAFEFINGAAKPLESLLTSAAGVLGGSFVSSLFSGAVQSVKGQKMLYPQIYKSSSGSMNYNFSMTLTSPYGDPYNYYMNIVVPLVHLICLAAPRMVTSNTVSSPYLVQAFIPGMCTCQLGIVTNMQIEKNPSTKHVSVDGYPLTVKVNFTISELYNNLSISPANDPSSFLFNETLNDYMCNLAGLIPSIDMFQHARNAQLEVFKQYFNLGERLNDLSQIATEKLDDVFNNFVGR